jgi:Xaa-Pro aminopeptidase
LFEAQAVTFSAYRELSRLGSEHGLFIEARDDPVALLRRIKSKAEFERIRRACEIASDALEHASKVIRPGVTERFVAWEVERLMREAGAEAIKSNHVIASGPRGALPHGQATDRVLERGDLITLDIGARVDGYYSDITRTFALGPTNARAREVYGLVLEAQTIALSAIRAKVVAETVDEVVRTFFQAHGVRERFTHSLGHGIGLEVHEFPRLAPGDRTVLQPGMVTSVEPGLYVPGWGGVRIEDLVFVEEGGVENLCAFPKALMEL